MKIDIFYHYMAPDTVVSAIHFHELSKGLVEFGHAVTAYPSNRARHNKQYFPKQEKIDGVNYRRVFRPEFSQDHAFGKLLSSAIICFGWMLVLTKNKRSRKPDFIIIGSDPVFSVFCCFVARLVYGKNVSIVHWCFDMHPEATIALKQTDQNIVIKLVKWLLKYGYNSCDLIFDLGPRMRERISCYCKHMNFATVTPWALIEPESIEISNTSERGTLFGDAEIGILYSGNYGKSHDLSEVINFARLIKSDTRIKFCFAISTSQSASLIEKLSPIPDNILIVEPVDITLLQERLSAADFHIVSVAEGFDGVVVPSKFFGALAIGRPILYSGDSSSDVACYINQFNLGFSLNSGNTGEAVKYFNNLLAKTELLQDLKHHCHKVYIENFSKEKMISEWNYRLLDNYSNRGHKIE